MLTNYDPDSNIEDLTDLEIYAAIRYLEPYPTNADGRAVDQDNDNGTVICFCLYIAVLVCLAFSWFYLL